MRLEEEVNGNYLIIGGVNANDSGVYTCQISAYKPTELQHSLTVRGEYSCLGNCCPMTEILKTTSPLLPAFPFSERLTIETVGEKGFPSTAANHNFLCCLLLWFCITMSMLLSVRNIVLILCSQ